MLAVVVHFQSPALAQRTRAPWLKLLRHWRHLRQRDALGQIRPFQIVSWHVVLSPNKYQYLVI